MIIFKKENILLDLAVQNKEEAIGALVKNMCTSKLVKETYYDAVIDRESLYPTGLPTEPFGVAIPHAGVEHVLSAGISMAVLRETVDFENMAVSDDFIPVKIIFLMANKNPGDHVEDLQELMDICSSETLLKEIAQITDVEEMLEKIQNL